MCFRFRCTNFVSIILQSLRELREQYENQIRANREEVDTIWDAKLKNVQNEASRSSRAAGAAFDELRSVRAQFNGLQSKINDMESENSSLKRYFLDSDQAIGCARNVLIFHCGLLFVCSFLCAAKLRIWKLNWMWKIGVGLI